MEKEEYLKIVKELTPKENKLRNSFYAFVVGGIVGFLGQAITLYLECMFNLTTMVASAWTTLIVIFLACLFTGLGFFDNLVSKYKCGLIIPTTGFAHSVMSSSLDAKNEGLIYGIGSNMFKLAGSVIVYGVVSAFILGLIRYLLGGV